MARFSPGTVFAGFTVVDLIGTGRIAEVFEVIAPGGAHRALKILREDQELTSKLQTRTAQEGEAIVEIDHVNVVRIFAAGVAEGRVWLLLELVRGKDLRRLLDEAGGALPVERAVRLVKQACEGVAAAHARGILHREIEPGNILVTGDDVAKVADFGSAKLEHHGVKTSSDLDVSAAISMAPEYIVTGEAQQASDVYAMGLVLYEAVSGKNPIAPEPMSGANILQRHLRHTPKALAALGLDLPGDLSALVERVLAKDPSKRGSMADLARELGEVLRSLTARRRAAVIGLPLPNRHIALAPTLPAMQVLEITGPAAEPGGRPGSGGEAGRAAVLPAAPAAGMASRAAVPPTQRSAGEGVHGGSASGPTPRAPAEPRAAPVRTMPMEQVAAPPACSPGVEAPAERGSTGIPVERPVPATAPIAGRRAMGPVLALGGALLLGAALAAGWLLGGRDAGGGPEVASGARSAATPVPAVTAAPATARPPEAPGPGVPASASAPHPKPPALGPRKAGPGLR